MQNEKIVTIDTGSFLDSDIQKIIELYFLKKENKLSQYLNEKKYRLNGDFTYRLVNYWEKEGLLTTGRENNSGWRKYSILDITWMYILLELRRFGYPIESLKALRSELVEQHPLFDSDGFPSMEGYISLILFYKIPVYLLVHSHGSCLVLTRNEKYKYEVVHSSKQQPYICISLNQLITSITQHNYSPDGSLLMVSSEEKELLSIINKGDFDSITIRLKNGKIDIIDMEQWVSNSEKIANLLRSHSYQSIEIKQKDGKISHIKRKVSKKMANLR